MSTPPSPHQVVDDPDLERYAAVDDVVWFDDIGWDAVLANARTIDHRWAATGPEGDASSPYRGIAGAFDMDLTLPGRPGGDPVQIPVSGVTWVGTHPDHRRSGVLSALMAHHLRWCRDQDLAVAVLHASDVGIYDRYGYAVASTAGQVKLGHGGTFRAPGVATDGIATSLHDLADPATTQRVHALHVALASTRVGTVTRSLDLARQAYVDLPARLPGSERRRVVIATRAGEDVGYALVRRRPGWSDGRSSATLECTEWAWADAPVQLALARRLTSVDLVTSTTISQVTADDAMLWWSGGPRTVVHTPGDELWVRVVDLPAALAARGWSADCDVVVEVTDDLLPDNAGRWRLHATDGALEVTPTEEPAGLTFAIGVLGATYLGGRRLAALARQGLVTVGSGEALRALDAALATPTLPVAPIQF